jgi:hypothetical protein
MQITSPRTPVFNPVVFLKEDKKTLMSKAAQLCEEVSVMLEIHTEHYRNVNYILPVRDRMKRRQIPVTGGI